MFWRSPQGHWSTSFQSIGVTKDWRPTVNHDYLHPRVLRLGFQSIGVTKDWRLPFTIGCIDMFTIVSNQ